MFYLGWYIFVFFVVTGCCNTLAVGDLDESGSYNSLIEGKFAARDAKSLVQQFNQDDLDSVKSVLLSKSGDKSIDFEPFKKLMGGNKWKSFAERIHEKLTLIQKPLAYFPVMVLVKGIGEYYIQSVNKFSDCKYKNKYSYNKTKRKISHVDLMDEFGGSACSRVAFILDKKIKSKTEREADLDESCVGRLSSTSVVIKKGMGGEYLNAYSFYQEPRVKDRIYTVTQWRDGKSMGSELSVIDPSHLMEGDVITLNNESLKNKARALRRVLGNQNKEMATPERLIGLDAITAKKIKSSVNVSPIQRSHDIQMAVSSLQKSLNKQYPDKFRLSVDDENMFKVTAEGVVPSGWWEDAYFKVEYEFNNVNNEGQKVKVIRGPDVAHRFDDGLCLGALSPHAAFQSFWSRDPYSSHIFSIYRQLANPIDFMLQDVDFGNGGFGSRHLEIGYGKPSHRSLDKAAKAQYEIAKNISHNNAHVQTSLPLERNRKKIYEKRLNNMLLAINDMPNLKSRADNSLPDVDLSVDVNFNKKSKKIRKMESYNPIQYLRDEGVLSFPNIESDCGLNICDKWGVAVKTLGDYEFRMEDLLGGGGIPAPVVDAVIPSDTYANHAANELSYKNNIFLPLQMEREGEVIAFNRRDISGIDSIRDFVFKHSTCKVGLLSEPTIYFKGKEVKDDDQLISIFDAMESENAKKSCGRINDRKKKHDDFSFISFSPKKNDENYDNWKVIIKPNKNMAKRSNFTRQYLMEIPKETLKRSEKYFDKIQYGICANAWVPDFYNEMNTPQKLFSIDAMAHFSNHFLRLPNDKKEWVAFKGNDIVLKSLLRVLSEKVTAVDVGPWRADQAWKPSQAFLDILLSRIRMAHAITDLSYDLKQKCINVFEKSMTGFFDNNTLSDFSYLPNYWGAAWMHLQELPNEFKDELRYRLTVNALSEFLVRTLTYSAQSSEVPEVIKKIHESEKDISIDEISNVNESGLSYVSHILTLMDFVSKHATENFSNIGDQELEMLQNRVNHVQIILNRYKPDKLVNILNYLYEDKVVEGKVDFNSSAFKDEILAAVVNEFNRRESVKKDPKKIRKDNLDKITRLLDKIDDPIKKQLLLKQLSDITGIPLKPRTVKSDPRCLDVDANNKDLYSQDNLDCLMGIQYYQPFSDEGWDELGDPEKMSLKNWKINAPALLDYFNEEKIFDTDHRKFLINPKNNVNNSVSDVVFPESQPMSDTLRESELAHEAMDTAENENSLLDRVKVLWPKNYINHEDGESETEPYKQTCQVCKEDYRTMNPVPRRKNNKTWSCKPMHSDCRERFMKQKKESRILFKRMLANRPKGKDHSPYFNKYNPIPDNCEARPIKHDGNVMFRALAELHNAIHPECNHWNVQTVRNNIHDNLTRIKQSIDTVNNEELNNQLKLELSIVTGIDADRIDDIVDQSVFLPPSDPGELETCAEQFGYGDVNVIPVLALSHSFPAKLVTDQVHIPRTYELAYWQEFSPNLLAHLRDNAVFNLDHWYENEEAMDSDANRDRELDAYLIKCPGDETKIPHFDIAIKLPEYVGMPESSQTEAMENLPSYHELNPISGEPTNLIPAGPPTYQEVIDGGGCY